MARKAEKHNCDESRERRTGMMSPLPVSTHMEIKALEKGSLKTHSSYLHPLERYLLNIRNKMCISV